MLLSVPRAVVLLGGAVSFVSAAAVPGPLREYTFDCVCAPVPPMRTCCRTCAIEPWRRAHAQMP